MTPTAIKYIYQSKNPDGHFFDKGTMKWFGDRMSSFGSRTVDGKVYMYRKPSARVNVFGTWKTAGIEFSSVWEFDPETGDLNSLSEEDKRE